MKQRGVWAVSVGLVAFGTSGLLLAPGCSGDPVLGDRVENVEDLGQVSQSLVGAWSFVGAPSGVWQGLTNNQYTGVVKDIEITATHQRIAALGTAWQRSAATGWSWVPMSDSLIPPGDPADGVQFSAIASKPNDSNRVLLGTGDGSPHRHQGDTWGEPGLYLSLNANNSTPTWSLVMNNSATGSSVRRIRFRTIGASMVFAATNNGLWKSTNSGSTWSSVLTGSMTDVAISYNDDQLYAAVRGEGLKRSSDWGVTWSYCHPTAGPDPTFDVSKIDTGSPNLVYLLRGKPGGFEGVYRIVDSPAPGSCVSTKFNSVNLAALGTMPDWYGTIAVHPYKPDTLLVGGIGVQRTQNASYGAIASWQDVSTGLHGDVHDLAFLGDGSNVLYAAEDAGVWYSLQAGAGWFNEANSFKAMSIHDFDIAPNASRIYGARWHAGPFTTDMSSWTSSTTASDAFAATIDPFDSSRGWYSMWPGGCRYRTTDSGATWLDANSGIGCSFEDYAPIEHDKVHQIYIYTLYQGKPYKSINLGQSWTAYQSTSLFWNGLAVGMYSGGFSTVYGFNSSLWASKAGNAFVDITPPGGSVGRVITHPTQVNTAYAVTPTKIYKTTTADAGSWVNITANFTPTSVFFKDVVVDPQNDQILFAATTRGVYKTTNGGTTWVRWVNGFANGGSKVIWRLRTVDLRSTGQGLWIYAAVGSSGIWKRDASTDGG